jgi:hypothetical protein
LLVCSFFCWGDWAGSREATWPLEPDSFFLSVLFIYTFFYVIACVY